MTEAVQTFDHSVGVARDASGNAPPLPIERHIVAAALTAERMRTLAVQMLLVLQHAPRDAATVDRLQDDILSAWSDLHEHHGAYRALLDCEGQA